ncbi:MAG: alpha/beta hydrolase [Paludibacteraceae bacterium]|jgi:S-formylglutathione hydrolase FrmB
MKQTFLKKTISLLLFSCGLLSVYAAKVDTVNVYSPTMDREIKAVVIVPESAYSRQTARPVIYLLHGYGGFEKSWIIKKDNLPEIADEKEVFFVCPNGESSWYINSPVKKESQFETFVAQELTHYIDSCYMTLPRADKRAITGLSMGGHGALYIAMRNPNIFGAAGSMSGGVDFRPFTEKWELKTILGDYNTNKAAWDNNVVVNQISKIKNREVELFIDCGKDDFFMPVNQELHNQLDKAGIEHDFIIRPGKHTWDYWLNAIDYHILFFTNFFNRK